MATSMYRQGDLLLVRVDRAPGKTRKIPRRGRQTVLLTGEKTGHAHVIEGDVATLLSAATGRRFVELTAPAQLIHEEHAALNLDAGVYEVVRQREFVPAPDDSKRWRSVKD